jgi:hypothetical protein
MRVFRISRAAFLVLVLTCCCVYAQVPESRNSLASSLPAVSGEASPVTEFTVPGPLRSLERMAGISQQAPPDRILPLFTRNVYVQGYVGWQNSGQPTEFLILLGRYLNQAQELAKQAGPDGVVHVSGCAEAEPLLRILGYRLRQECGQMNATLITADQERAFLTADSGFPLTTLEDALRKNKPFAYRFPASPLPLLFSEQDWIELDHSDSSWKYGLLDSFLHRPALARLYWAFSRIDPETRVELRKAPGLRKLLPFAPELDFYGSHIVIRHGRVLVPGGPAADVAWKDLVGASPDAPGEFVSRLLARDKGWLAAFYDCFARINREQQQHFADAHRLRTLYAAFHSSRPSMNAARPAFRLASGLLLLLTHMQWDAQGNAIIPGDVALWQGILKQKYESKAIREWSKKTVRWKSPEQVIDAMFAFSPLQTDRGPLQMFLLFSELNSQRPPGQKLSSGTLRVLASRFDEYKDQYVQFSEFPQLDDTSLTSFVGTADAIQDISNRTLRGNVMGTLEAEVGLWKILARQQQIPVSDLNASWQALLKSFEKVETPAQLFDAGREGLASVLQAAAGSARLSQNDVIELLAGPRSLDPEAQRVHQQIAQSMRAAMDGQRLVPLDTLLALGKGLDEMERGAKIGETLVPLAAELQEFQMPRPIFTSSERSEWAAGVYNNRHTQLQMQTDVAKILKSSPSHDQLEQARGQLAPFLRDTLVGLNYAYYKPPGSQLLRNNPLFVRSHDFSGETVAGIEDLWEAPQVFGQGTPAGGGAHLVGSLADLPYVLSEAEQDFITPLNVQALIWRETVPGLLTDAIMPRWWNVTPTEMHAVALYQVAGEDLLTSAVSDDTLRTRLMKILSDRMPPVRSGQIENALASGRSDAALDLVTPADTFYLTAEYRKRFPNDNVWGAAGRELNTLNQEFPDQVSLRRLSRDFGVPHPVLEQSYARELLNVEPFPAFAGYSSRLMAECWDSNNLYWARLADEMHYPPVMLNVLVPELTRRMVEKIFATDFEDWSALLRAMREAGYDFRAGNITIPEVTTASVRAPR